MVTVVVVVDSDWCRCVLLRISLSHPLSGYSSMYDLYISKLAVFNLINSFESSGF